MRLFSRILAGVLLCSLAGVGGAATISDDLQRVLQSGAAEVSVIVRFSDRVDVGPFVQALVRSRGKAARDTLRWTLVTALQQRGAGHAAALRAVLGALPVQRVVDLWIDNGVALTLPAQLVPFLSRLPGIDTIRLDRALLSQGPGGGVPVLPPIWNLDAVGVPEFWSEGLTGLGLVVANVDTGVDGAHPSLASKWRGGGEGWLDTWGQHPGSPYDASGHGTQSMGIMVAGDDGINAVGMLPDAQWIAARIFNDAGQSLASHAHQALQWYLAMNDPPDVINNSWVMDGTAGGCDTEFQQDIQLLEAAGIPVVFSGGNYGPLPGSDTSPGNLAGVTSVGSVDYSLTVDYSSSRGPSSCDGGLFPTVVAPGVSIRTTDLSFGGIIDYYATVDGTSFAAPHVAAGMALLKQAVPDANVSDLKNAIRLGAVDLGMSGDDGDYGAGLLDLDGARGWLLNTRLTHGLARVDLAGGITALAVLLRDAQDGQYWIQVLDATNGNVAGAGAIQVLDPDWTAYDFDAVPGAAPMVAVLARNSAGDTRVAVFDAATGAGVASIAFPTGVLPYGLAGTPEGDVAVLYRIPQSGSLRAEVRDLLGAQVQLLSFPKVYEPVGRLGFQALANIPGSPSSTSELAMLGVDSGNSTVRVEIRDIGGTPSGNQNLVNFVNFGNLFTPQDFGLLPDTGLLPEAQGLAVSGVYNDRAYVYRKTLDRDPLNPSINYGPGNRPVQISVIEDADGNGHAEIALLGAWSDGQVRLQTRDPVSRAFLTSQVLDAGFTPVAMVPLPDLTGNGGPEIAVLTRNPDSGQVRVQRRDVTVGAPNSPHHQDFDLP